MSDDERRALYGALDLLGDAISGGYRLRRPEPEFEEEAAFADSAPPERAAIESPAPGAQPPARQGDSLQLIAQEAARCRACRLAATRGKTVPGQGARSPLVLVVGEGPGADEDASGLPFVGPAGQLLDRMLASIGLSRDTNCFIANIVKCRPPNNRDPAPDEQAACIPYLERQFLLLKPKVVLAVGRVPAQTLLGVKEGIGRLRGKAYDFRGTPLVATYHPSALLRDEALKRPAWEDLKLLKTLLGN